MKNLYSTILPSAYEDLRKVFAKIVCKLTMTLFKNENQCFYINGPDTLPPPLTKEEEAELISRMNTDASAKNALIERNLRLVIYIAKKFENTGVGIEDLISIGTIGLMKAVNSFKSEKEIKLATYASRCIENEILMFIRKNAGLKNEVSIDEPLNVDWDGNELLLSDLLGTDSDYVNKDIEKAEDVRLIRAALSRLEDRERVIIELRFGITTNGKEKTQKEVADMLGISQSYISRLEKKIMVKLKDELKKMNFHRT
ncbi:MAG: RNA polymerase sporulation sigma factor SigE [Ruminococcaceae bacterium]|nr:RNA polymerase sporulation sigma factor SigE [Oscillospiraceae bacterium]